MPLAAATITTLGSEDVFLTAKMRVQAFKNEQSAAPPDSGLIYFWITVDGQIVGTVGMQEIRSDPTTGAGADSQRTLCASASINSPSSPFPPGAHDVRVYGLAIGNFDTLRAYQDQVLVWID